MAVGFVSLRQNRCRYLCGYFRGLFKVLVLLGMCGWLYYYNQLPVSEERLDKSSSTKGFLKILPTSSLTKENVKPHAFQQENESTYIFLPTIISQDCLIPDDQITEDSCVIEDSCLSLQSYDVVQQTDNTRGISEKSSPTLEQSNSNVAQLKGSLSRLMGTCNLEDLHMSPHSKQTPNVVQQTDNTCGILETSIYTQEQSNTDVAQSKEGMCIVHVALESDQEESTLEVTHQLEGESDLKIAPSYTEDEFTAEVVQLLKENFEILVLSNQDPWLVEFYAPWCPHCKSFAEVYVKIAESLAGVINVGKVNGAEVKYLTKQFGIRSYPSLLFFNGKNKTSPFTYKGPRTEDDVVRVVLELLNVSTCIEQE